MKNIGDSSDEEILNIAKWAKINVTIEVFKFFLHDIWSKKKVFDTSFKNIDLTLIFYCDQVLYWAQIFQKKT